MRRVIGRRMVGAAAATGSALAHDRVMCDQAPSIRAPDWANECASSAVFDEWAKKIEQQPYVIKELRPNEERVKNTARNEAAACEGNTVGKSLIWHTLQGKGKIEHIRLWKCSPDEEQMDETNLKFNERPGDARIQALVQLGGDICGHPQYVHGGFTAALLDDMLGWTTFQEKSNLEENLPAEINIQQAKIFTAKLTVNYRRPVKLNGTYLVECKVSRVERVKKIWLECTIYDQEGNTLVEGDSLYIITGIDQEKATALYTEKESNS